MSRLRKGVLVGLTIAAAGVAAAVIPSVSALEESLGVRWLFRVRGELDPPGRIAIISIDQQTTTQVESNLVRDWPRRKHGELLDRLVALGASAVAFDIEFLRQSTSEQEDAQFAAAVRRAGRVALVERLGRARVGTNTIWERHQPIAELAKAALAVAPVPLPDSPLLTSSWAFVSTPQMQDVPSLAAVTLQIHLLDVFSEFERLVANAGFAVLPRADPTAAVGDLSSAMQAIRHAVRADADRQKKLRRLFESIETGPEARRSALRSLAGLYSGPAASFLNFYGFPGTICTIPYETVLATSEIGPTRSGDGSGRCGLTAVRGSAVFVGAGASRIARADQADSYHTVLGGADGTDFSGVEIHATAFANLLEQRTLNPVDPPVYLAVLVGFGLGVGALVHGIRTRGHWHEAVTPRLQATRWAVYAALLYTTVCYLLFSRGGLILPLIVPLLLQLPLALIVALTMAAVKDEREAWAICLVTDAENSTQWARRLGDAKSGRLLFDYQDEICRKLLNHHGVPLNPKGDGLLCVWLRRAPDEIDDLELRHEICLTALGISALDYKGLKTRVGIAIGKVRVHSDADRGPYNMSGQAVVLAARLQEAAGPGGVLVSAGFGEGLSGKLILERRTFKPKGFDEPVEAFQVNGAASESVGAA